LSFFYCLIQSIYRYAGFITAGEIGRLNGLTVSK